MMLRLDLSSFSETKPHEYAVRFLFGGFCTAVAGLIAKRFGPEVGGLFLAFPAIFPAAASLIQSHEKRRKAEIGRDGTMRGKDAAALDAFGAAVGCVGLVGFGVCVWQLVTRVRAGWMLAAALVCWSALAVGTYLVREHWPRVQSRHP